MVLVVQNRVIRLEMAMRLARVRAKELVTNRDLKQAIREWQPDCLRA